MKPNKKRLNLKNVKQIYGYSLTVLNVYDQ